MPLRKEVKLYGDLIHHHKPNIRTIIWRMMIDYFAKKNRFRKSPYINDRPLEEEVVAQRGGLKMHHFAIIKNGIVEEIIVVNEIIADLLENKRLKFVRFSPDTEPVGRGMKFENNTFFAEILDEELNEKED